jgi:hypothetical protein
MFLSGGRDPDSPGFLVKARRLVIPANQTSLAAFEVFGVDERHSFCTRKGISRRIASKCPSLVTNNAPV